MPSPRRLIAVVTLLLAPAGLCANTSNSLMDVSRDSKRLLVANTDNGTVSIVDAEKKAVLHEIKVGKKPEGVSWIGAGPTAVVTLYEGSAVVFIDADKGTVLEKVTTKAEPYGVVVNKDGTRAWVTHEYPGLVSEIDTASRKVIREIPAGSHVRGIALAPDEKRVYVSEFYSGILNAVDLGKAEVVESWKGHSTDNLARHVLLHPTRPKAYLAHIRSIIHITDGRGSIFPQLSICDLKAGPGKRRISIGMDTFNSVYVVTNPWESDIAPDGKRFYIIYAGTNDMNMCNVVDDDYQEVSRISLPSRTGTNPRAVRVSPDGQAVYIYNFLDFEVSVHDAKTMAVKGKIKVCEPAKTPEWIRGKVLFNTANFPMTSARWIACSSCHPDGHHDARAWSNPEGLRKTTALYGLAHTHPLHWSADRDEVQDFEYTIRSRLMAGPGLIKGTMKLKRGFEKIELEEKTSGRSKDLDAIAIYCNTFEFPLSPHISAPGKLSAQAQRGKGLFFNKEVNCASCHSGPYYTDSSLKKPFNLHDVGSWSKEIDPNEKMGPAYDTPTLLGIYRTAPYMHHGKAKTLMEVLTVFNKEDKHGKTSHLKKNELEDLVEFLKSLPYEEPPMVTENTVPYHALGLPKKKE
ncbi:MAG: di-heme oxidoredictase family protein [Gemmataceae bacterium]